MKYGGSGAVIFRKDQGQYQCVIVRQNKTNYGFPKGGCEPGESALETAIREVKEETGLTVGTDVFFYNMTPFTEWNYYRKIHVAYFVGQLSSNHYRSVAGNDTLRWDPNELDFACWMSVREAFNLLPPRRRHLLGKAFYFLSTTRLSLDKSISQNESGVRWVQDQQHEQRESCGEKLLPPNAGFYMNNNSNHSTSKNDNASYLPTTMEASTVFPKMQLQLSLPDEIPMLTLTTTAKDKTGLSGTHRLSVTTPIQLREDSPKTNMGGNKNATRNNKNNDNNNNNNNIDKDHKRSGSRWLNHHQYHRKLWIRRALVWVLKYKIWDNEWSLKTVPNGWARIKDLVLMVPVFRQRRVQCKEIIASAVSSRDIQCFNNNLIKLNMTKNKP